MKLPLIGAVVVPLCYSTEMQALGIKSITKLGFAFSGKRARIAAEKQITE